MIKKNGYLLIENPNSNFILVNRMWISKFGSPAL